MAVFMPLRRKRSPFATTSLKTLRAKANKTARADNLFKCVRACVRVFSRFCFTSTRAQFNGVSGPGNDVSFNSGVNYASWVDPEDLVSAFSSSGTSASPMRFSNNCFQGGGPSMTGGGLVS
jgi:uncharacterized membrane protein YgcG